MEEKPSKEIIDRIKKLLVKHDGCKKIKSESEAEIALNLAFSLMRKHHLDMSSVLCEQAYSDDDIFIIEKECEKFIANELPVWLQNLVQLVNTVCNTQCVLRKYKTNKSAKQLYINFIGETQDVSRCCDMYKFFKGTASRLGYKHQREVKGNFRHWRSFVEGFTNRLLEKALLAEKQEEQKVRQFENQNTDSGFQSIDDMEDVGDDDSYEENEQQEEYGIILQKNELISVNRYKKLVKDKIKIFIANQDAKTEKLKESRIIDSSSFAKGRSAANQYGFSKNSSSNLKLENK